MNQHNTPQHVLPKLDCSGTRLTLKFIKLKKKIAPKNCYDKIIIQVTVNKTKKPFQLHFKTIPVLVQFSHVNPVNIKCPN